MASNAYYQPSSPPQGPAHLQYQQQQQQQGWTGPGAPRPLPRPPTQISPSQSPPPLSAWHHQQQMHAAQQPYLISPSHSIPSSSSGQMSAQSGAPQQQLPPPALATNLMGGGVQRPLKTKKRISIDMISAPQPGTFVHAAHASDAEQAEIILKRWSRDGMGRIADPRWVNALKDALRMQAAQSQAQAIAEVQAALHQDSIIQQQPRQLEIKNGAPSTTASTIHTTSPRGKGPTVAAGPGYHVQPPSQYYSAVGDPYPSAAAFYLPPGTKTFDHIQEEGAGIMDDITTAVVNLISRGPLPSPPANQPPQPRGDGQGGLLSPPQPPFLGLGLPRSNTQETMLIYTPDEADSSERPKIDNAPAMRGAGADYMQYRPSASTLANAKMPMASRPNSKYDGLPGAENATAGRPATMLIHDPAPPAATGLPHSQDPSPINYEAGGQQQQQHAQQQNEQQPESVLYNPMGTVSLNGNSAVAGGLALALQAAAVRPSLQTIEKSVATKIYFENLYHSILKKPRARDTRRAGLEAELASLGNRISDREKEAIRAKWLANETDYLREMRARVNINSFSRLKTIGHGAFGVVSLVKEKSKGGLYAMKQLRKADMLKKGQEGHVRAERDLMTSASASASAKWIVKLVYSFQDMDNLYLIMEFMGGGDLLNLLIEKDIFEEDFARFYVAEMILGIHEAHRFGYIHRDIKPDNFLFTPEGHIKLADFGLCQSFHWAHDGAYYDQQRKNLLKKHGIDLDDSHSPATAGRRRGAAAQQQLLKQRGNQGGLNDKELNDVMSDRNEDGTPMTHVLTWRDKNKKKIAYSVVGTNNYMAPEVLRGLGYDQSCDWWSLGVIVFEMLYGYPPFVSKSRHLTRQKILNWRQTLKFPPRPKVSRDAQDFISKLICEREDRLGTAAAASVSRPNSIIQRERRSGIISSNATGANNGGQNNNNAPAAPPGLADGVEDLMSHPWFRNIDWNGLHRQRAPFRPALAHPADTKHFEDDIEAEPLPAPGAGEAGANPNADQPRDPMLRDKQHGKNLLEMRKQLAFLVSVSFMERGAGGGRGARAPRGRPRPPAP
ncbi:hypothetical protein OC861_006672 [Tilletia horrida]|nr:hypothetical protein OC861_006672 [Tilletia horrida]